MKKRKRKRKRNSAPVLFVILTALAACDKMETEPAIIPPTPPIIPPTPPANTPPPPSELKFYNTNYSASYLRDSGTAEVARLLTPPEIYTPVTHITASAEEGALVTFYNGRKKLNSFAVPAIKGVAVLPLVPPFKGKANYEITATLSKDKKVSRHSRPIQLGVNALPPSEATLKKPRVNSKTLILAFNEELGYVADKSKFTVVENGIAQTEPPESIHVNFNNKKQVFIHLKQTIQVKRSYKVEIKSGAVADRNENLNTKVFGPVLAAGESDGSGPLPISAAAQHKGRKASFILFDEEIKSNNGSPPKAQYKIYKIKTNGEPEKLSLPYSDGSSPGQSISVDPAESMGYWLNYFNSSSISAAWPSADYRIDFSESKSGGIRDKLGNLFQIPDAGSRLSFSFSLRPPALNTKNEISTSLGKNLRLVKLGFAAPVSLKYKSQIVIERKRQGKFLPVPIPFYAVAIRADSTLILYSPGIAPGVYRVRLGDSAVVNTDGLQWPNEPMLTSEVEIKGIE